MRIIQLSTKLDIGGRTTFISHMNTALKLAGHDVKLYVCDSGENKKEDITISGAELFDYSDNKIDELNNADYVFVHDLMGAKCNKELVDKYYGLLKNLTSKKVFFMNAHSISAYKYYGTGLFKDKEFMNMFDYFATFSPNSAVCKTLKETLGEDEFNKRYVRMQHTYFFDDNIKKSWVPFDQKKNRITYIGRFAGIKHIEQIIKLHMLCPNEFEFEIRGVDRSIGSACVPDLFYELDTTKPSFKESIVGPSKETLPINSKWKKEHGIAEDNLMIDYPHGDKIMVFGPYDKPDGMKAIANSMFGIECYRLKDSKLYGDNIEYAMFEIIEQGTIPIFDSFTAKSVHMWKDGKRGETMYDLGLGVFLEPDMGNADKVIEQLKELRDNKDKYDELRERCWNAYKDHSDPKSIMTTFINELNSKRNNG